MSILLQLKNAALALQGSLFRNQLMQDMGVIETEVNRIGAEMDGLAVAVTELWVSGTNYATGKIIRSPADTRIYKRLAPGGSTTTDPSLDATNWVLVPIAASSVSNTPAGNITATDVQAAINQLDSHISAIGNATFTSSGNFTVPALVTTVYLTGSGGGGGGGAYNGASGAGGGGGAASCIKRAVTVTPGAVIAVTIGSGGAGSQTQGTGGAAGGTTSFGALLSLGGGGGGNSVGGGGGGGSPSGGSGGAVSSGTAGEQYNPRGTVSGGQGGSSTFGTGGVGGGTGSVNGSGASAVAFGAGGGGGASGAGGNGSSGFLLIEWGN